MKKLIYVLLCVLLAMSLMACEEKVEEHTGGESKDIVKETDTEPKSEVKKEETTKQSVEITWLTFETPGLTAQLYDGIIEKFESEHDHIKVTREICPQDRDSYLKTMFATGQLQDVVIGADALTNVDDALLPLDESIYSLLEDAAVFRKNGEVRFIPLSKQIKANIFYNKDLFKKYQLEVPSTWDDFVHICDVLKSNGEIPIIGGGPDKPWLTGAMVSSPLLTDALNSYSPTWPQDMKDGKITWDGPIVKDAIYRWRHLVDQGYYHEGSFDFTYAQMVDEFLKGSAAMVVNGVWMAAQIDDTETPFEAGWFALPGMSERKYLPVDFGNPLAISKSTEHPEEAKAFVKYFITNEEVYGSFLKADGSQSTTKEVVRYDMGPVQLEVLDRSKNLESVIQYLKVKGEDALPPGLKKVTNSAWQNIFLGSDVDKELEDVEKKYRQFIADQK